MIIQKLNIIRLHCLIRRSEKLKWKQYLLTQSVSKADRARPKP